MIMTHNIIMRYLEPTEPRINIIWNGKCIRLDKLFDFECNNRTAIGSLHWIQII